MIMRIPNVNPINMVLKLISWIIFMSVAIVLMKKKQITTKNAFFLLIASILINGFILGSDPNPVSPIQQLVNGNFNPLFVIPIILLLIISALFGRVFCGYTCPVGATQELIWMIREKIFKKNLIIKIPIKIAQTFRGIVFIVMIILGLVFVPAFSLFGTYNPFKIFNVTQQVYNLTFYLTLLTFVAAIFVYRPFCRLVCPFGFLAGIISRIAPKRFQRNTKCIDCGLCERKCPTGDLDKEKHYGECYMCGRCINKCQKDGLDYKLQIKK